MTLLAIGGAIGIALAFYLLWHWKQQSNPRVQLDKAEKALREGRVEAAHTLFLRVVGLVEGSKARSADQIELASKAHLAIAVIEERRQRRQEAAIHCLKAKAMGALLPIGAILLLAEFYAEKHETGDDVVEIYLTYINSGPKTGAAAEQVYSAMQSLCQVTEDMRLVQRKSLAELNSRVIAVNPNLEWAHYFLGLARLLDGRSTEAIDSFLKARNLNPDRALTYYWLGACYLQMPVPNLNAAIDVIEQFLSFKQSDTKNRKREARICREIAKQLIKSVEIVTDSGGDFDNRCRVDLDRAIHYLEIAVDRLPEDASSQHELGKAYRLGGLRENAIAAFRQALHLNHGEKQYAYDLGLEYIKSGQMSNAIEVLERAVQISPAYAEAHGVLGRVYFGQGNYDKAVDHLQTALSSEKRNPIHLGLLVRALCAQGHYRRVTEDLDCRKSDLSPFADDLDAVYAAGRSYSAQGRFEEAIAWLKQVPERPDATYFLGCAHANLNEFTAARTFFDQLSRTDSEWARKAILQRGHLMFLQGDFEGAKEGYRQVVGADPNDCEALHALGKLALERGDFDEAISQLSTAVTIEPENGEPHFALGVAFERKGDLVNALQSYECASHGTNENFVLLRIGIVRCRLGAFAEASKALDRCAELGNISDTLLFYRGMVFALLGRCQDSICDWTELQHRHRNNERLQLNLARVRYVLGTQYLVHGKYEAAIEQWEQYLSQYSKDDNVVKDLGELHFRTALDAIRKESQDALLLAYKSLQVALCLDPQNQKFRFYSALCGVKTGSGVDDFMTTLQSLIEEKWQTPRVLYHLGWCLLQIGQTDAAAQVFGDVQATPDANSYQRYGYWALANAMIDAGKFAEASEILLYQAEPASGTDREIQQ